MTTGAVLSRGLTDRWPPEGEGSPMDGEAIQEENGAVIGVSDPTGESEEGHAEVGTDSSESGEEYSEATPEQLAQEVSEESAEADLEGYDAGEAGEESAYAEALGVLPEAGSAVEGGQEFLPLLAGLATTVIPMLASKAGPALARAVQGRLSARTKRILAKPRPGGGTVAVLQKLLAQALKGSETAEEAEEATAEAAAEEVAAILEVVIGTDDRARINNTVKVPWRRYCALRIEFPTGAVYRGTGFFIGGRVLATAGHCVYLKNQGGWARRIEVIPACNGSIRPFRSAVATTFRSTTGWTQNQAEKQDYGAIILPAGAFPGQQFGTFGFKTFDNRALLATPVVLAGYPGDKPFAELWGMRRKIKTITATNLIYDIDTMGGQSGAPVYMKHGGERYVVGIHNYGASTGNSATRVTAEVIANFKKWSTLGASPKPAVATPAPTGSYPKKKEMAQSASRNGSGLSDADV